MNFNRFKCFGFHKIATPSLQAIATLRACVAVASTHRAVYCSFCEKECHIKCGKINMSKYKQITTQSVNAHSWICPLCIFSILPFSDCMCDKELSNTLLMNDQQTNDKYACFANKGIHFVHCNARSLIPKISELKIIAHKSNASIIAISETLLDSSVIDNEISIGYLVMP